MEESGCSYGRQGGLEDVAEDVYLKKAYTQWEEQYRF